MKYVAVIDVQPEVEFNKAITNLLVKTKVKEGNIGLEKLYSLVACKSRIIERVWIGNLKDNCELHLIIDEEGSFGQWDRGFQILNQDGYKHTILGNAVLVKATPDGDWVGWDTELELINAISDYVQQMRFFQLENAPQ
jgi:hypothetical protein